MNQFTNLYKSLCHFNGSLQKTAFETTRDYIFVCAAYVLAKTRMMSYSSLAHTNKYSVHTLVSHHDVPFYIICIYSFLRFLPNNPHKIVYDDGTLTKNDYVALSTIPEIRILTPSEVKLRASKEFRKEKSLLHHRNQAPYNRKLIDILLYKNNDEKILLLDCDVLFFQKPKQLVDFLTLPSPQADLLFIRDMKNAYIFSLLDIKKIFKINCTKYVNTGVLAYKSNLLNTKFVVNYYNALQAYKGKKIIFNPWVEQTGYALFSSTITSKPLTGEYIIGNTHNANAICKHYVHDARSDYAKDLLKLFFQKSSA